MTEKETQRRLKLIKRNQLRKGIKQVKRQVVCTVCGKTFLASRNDAIYCSSKCGYNSIDDPIEKKALTLSSPIIFGGKHGDKRRFFKSLILQSLNKPCRYCGELLTLERLSLDHITPFGGVKERANKLIQKQLNKPENLQIICKKCNQMKGELPSQPEPKACRYLLLRR